MFLSFLLFPSYYLIYIFCFLSLNGRTTNREFGTLKKRFIIIIIIIITLIYFSTKKNKLVNTHRQVNCIDQPNTNKTDKQKTKQQQYQTKCSPYESWCNNWFKNIIFLCNAVVYCQLEVVFKLSQLNP